MKIGFVVNKVATEEAGYTTIRLALTAHRLGHEAWIMGVGDFAYDPDNCMRARAHGPSAKNYKDTEDFLHEIQSNKARVERITADELDVLMLRNDPAADKETPWAQSAGITFGELAVSHGVLVLNHPHTLSAATNKMYFQHFPEIVRPRTLITRDIDEIRQFVKSEGAKVVIKPLQGSGGDSVFLLSPDDSANLNQMVEAVARDGYVIAQEYLPAAAQGDIRLFMMNGQPLQNDGKYAAFRRISASGDVRSNIHAGGRLEKAEITDEVLQLAEIVRPKLVSDGMFLVGLDIVGDKLMEINVFSPGGLGSAQRFAVDKDFTLDVIHAIERKVEYKRLYAGKIDNLTLSTL